MSDLQVVIFSLDKKTSHFPDSWSTSGVMSSSRSCVLGQTRGPAQRWVASSIFMLDAKSYNILKKEVFILLYVVMIDVM